MDAFVHCRCFIDGHCPPPPVPVVYDMADGLLPETGDLESDLAFEAWQASACEHESMRAASEWIANWASYRRFQTAVFRLGVGVVPTLIGELPNSNGGHVSPTDSARCIDELLAFQNATAAWPVIELMAGDEVVATRVEAYDGVFAWLGGDGLELGLSADAQLFVRRRDGGEVLLLAPEVAQEAVDDHASVRFRTATGVSVILSMGPIGGGRPLRVRARPGDAAEFTHIVDCLHRLFVASLETDLPVHWT